MGRHTFGMRKTDKARRDLAELKQVAKPTPPPQGQCRGGGFIVTFSHGTGDNFSDLRVFVWSASRVAALYRALTFFEVEEWLKSHPQANYSVMSVGLAPDDFPEGKIYSSRAA